jgi:putative acetyltransferase
MKEATQMKLRVNLEDPDQPEIIHLLADSHRYSASLYPAESNHHLPLAALRAAHVRFLVARDCTGRAVATGALAFNEFWAELKQMWVVPEMRGKGISKIMLNALEANARQKDVRCLRLETGIDNHAALALYERAGFTQRGPFGDYHPDPLSVFMEKRID